MTQPYIFGWNSEREVASEIWCSIHSSLLAGNLVFAIKPIGTCDLKRMIVVSNNDNTFGIGLVTSGFTALIPKAPLSYIQSEVEEDSKKYKFSKDIINNITEKLKEYGN